jgi:ABC-type transport system substrate-binding protein
MLLSACQPEVVTVTVTVEKEGETIVVTATPDPDAVEGEAAPEGGEAAEEDGEMEVGAGDVYRIAVLSDMTTRNIWAAYDPDSSIWNYAVYSNMYPAAYTLTDHRWDFVPSAAVDYPTDLEEEGDFWVSTVEFKEDALWSDGSPITAEDWAWTANAVLGLELSGNWTSAYPGSYLDRIEAVDEKTAKLYYHTKPGLARHQYGTLQAPILNKAFWAPKVDPLVEEFNEATADMEPESDDYIAAREEYIQQLYQLDASGEPSGGPFNFNQWEPGAFSEIVANPNYFGKGTQITEYADGGYLEVRPDGTEWGFGEQSGDVVAEYEEGPWFESVIFTVYNADAALLALDAGEVDFILTPNGLSRGQVDQISENPSISAVNNPANGFRYLAFNYDVAPLDDSALHQAIACMIDKEFLTQNLMQGAAIPVDTIVPESNGYWYNPDVPLFCDGMSTQERLEEAVRILKDAGYTWETEPGWNEARGGSVEWGEGLTAPDGTLVPEVELLAPSAGYDPLRATAGVYIEQWINQLGMPCEANLTNFNNILDQVFGGGEWDMFILGWGVTAFPDYVCDFFYTGESFNVGNYSNPEFDALCDEFYAETDRTEAQQQSYQLQEYLATDLPYIYLFTTPMWDAWDNSSVFFPFTDVTDGLGSGAYGLKAYVKAVK